MSDENSKKTLWMLIAGAGALIGAAVLLNYLHGDQAEDKEAEIIQALKDLKIGEPVRS